MSSKQKPELNKNQNSDTQISQEPKPNITFSKVDL